MYWVHTVCVWGILSLCNIIFSYSTIQSSFSSLIQQGQLGLPISCFNKGDGLVLIVTPLSRQMVVIMRGDLIWPFSLCHCATSVIHNPAGRGCEWWLKKFSNRFLCHTDSADEYTEAELNMTGALRLSGIFSPHTHSPFAWLRALFSRVASQNIPRRSSASLSSLSHVQKSLKTTRDHAALWLCSALSLPGESWLGWGPQGGEPGSCG